MLKALYDYGMRTGLALSPGFTPKPIRAYILLTADGDFLGIEPCENETKNCPDIGSLANSPDKCNPLAEKRRSFSATRKRARKPMRRSSRKKRTTL